MKFYTLHEVALVMKVSESTVRRLIQRGSLIAYKVGPRGQLRIREEDLEKYIEAQIVRIDNPSDDRIDKASQHSGDDQ